MIGDRHARSRHSVSEDGKPPPTAGQQASHHGSPIEIEVHAAEEVPALPKQTVTRLRAVAESVLRAEGSTGEATIVITGDNEVQQLNRDFAGIDAPTDVLAFGAQEESEGFVAAPEASGYLGDVVISFPCAAAQAQEAGHPVEQELELLIVHGLLHLLGYDHTEEQDRAVMWTRQESILHQTLDVK